MKRWNSMYALLSSKRYENKAGEFITGLDMTVEQLREKREERAKRFGIPAKPHDPKVNYEELYKSLGMKANDRHDERGIRPEAIHVRGLEEMNTQDVFKYFQEFGPGSIEWIDDTSCNVVWLDPISAARALMKLSVSHASVEKYLKKDDKSDTRKTDSSVFKKQKSNSKPEVEESEDDDELDLTEDPASKEKEEKETPMDTSETEDKNSTEVNRTESESKEEEMEEGEISDGSEADEEGFEAYKNVTLSRVIWPPGEWRLGVPSPKAKYLFFRFATKADVKLPGLKREVNIMCVMETQTMEV
ncbi:nuclear cap-binding protein subunit 3-like isoform X2 [Liolophura sinensis]|uniref:nuclear cap-binding protein subunit 3-like isoform X2 n=1 Tax=Liolophura sinensis TaxID=3198878 RepID=UPI003158D21B